MIRRATVAAVALLCLLAGAPAASAAPVSEVIEGQHLRIVSTADPSAMRAMLPGDVAVWDVSISADAPEPGTIAIALSGTGELPLVADVRSCDEPWAAGGCASGEASLARALPAPLDGSRLPVLEIPADAVAHLRLDVAVPHDARPASAASTVLRVHADGSGDALAAVPPGAIGGTLPPTGMPLSGAALLAIGAVMTGLTGVWLLRGRRSEPAA